MATFNLDDYVQVNERIEKFYQKYPEGSIQTEITELNDKYVIFKAFAYRNQEDSKPSTGYAMEKEGSSYINKTSHIENCETSAVGRALAMLGFEIKKSVASREEVANAKLNQEDKSKIFTKKVDSKEDVKKVISEKQGRYLRQIQSECKLSNDEVKDLIESMGLESSKELTNKTLDELIGKMKERATANK